MSGSARNLEEKFLVNMVRGKVYLQISSEEVPQGELRSQVSVDSGACSRRFPHLQLHNPMAGSCHDGSQKYYTGDNWIPEDDKCSSCTCEVTT